MQTIPLQSHAEREPSIKLGAGQCFNVHLGAGSTVTSRSGALRLAGPPRWLGEQVFRAEMTLGGGEAHIITDGGWITLTAGPLGSEANIRQVKATTALAGFLNKAVRLLAARTRGTRRAGT